MSNKIQLQTNNTKLNLLVSKAMSIQETVDSLPFADGFTPCTVHLNWYDDMNMQPFTFMYSDGSGRVISHTTSAADNPETGEACCFSGDLICAKGSLLYIPPNTVTASGWQYITVTGDIERPLGEYSTIFAVNGDGTISW
jgi:hypothetical protein